MRQLGEAMSAKQAVELRDAHIAHAAMLQQLEARYKSELQDVQNARPTEIDYITGYLLQVADRYGIATPRNRALFTGVKSLGN